MEREKILATRVVVGPLPSSLAAGQDLDPNSGSSTPIPSQLDLALAPPADEPAVRHR